MSYTREDYETLFKETDTDSSGYLSKTEVFAVLTKSEYSGDFEAAFAGFDTGGDGKVSLEEFLKHVMGIPDRREAMKNAFKGFDKSGDGFIDTSELKAVFAESNKSFSEQELKRMIELADDDGSGTLNYEEFLKNVFGVSA